MAKGIRKLRLKAEMTQAELAAQLGVAATDVSKWERGWEEPPTLLVKEMALLFDCSAAAVLGREIDVESEHWNTDYALTKPEEPYGMLRVTLARGGTYEFPISLTVRKRVLEQLRDFDTIRDNDDLRPWLTVSSLDNRALFLNPRLLRKIAVIGDDDEEMPDFEHPEVYRTLENWDDLYGQPVPPKLAEACNRELARREGETDPGEQDWHTLIVWDDGTKEWCAMIEEDDASGISTLDMTSYDVPPSTLMLVQGIGYYKAEHINLDYVAMLSAPLERFLRLIAPHPRTADDDDEPDDPDDVVPEEVVEEIIERIEGQIASAGNDNRTGPLKR
jgi:transcriptional regulator with XRE-family HTH domain